MIPRWFFLLLTTSYSSRLQGWIPASSNRSRSAASRSRPGHRDLMTLPCWSTLLQQITPPFFISPTKEVGWNPWWHDQSFMHQPRLALPMPRSITAANQSHQTTFNCTPSLTVSRSMKCRCFYKKRRLRLLRFNICTGGDQNLYNDIDIIDTKICSLREYLVE